MSAYRNSSHTGRFARSMDEAFGVRSTYAQIEPMPDTRPPVRGGWALYLLIVCALCLAAYADMSLPDSLQADQIAAADARQAPIDAKRMTDAEARDALADAHVRIARK